MNWKNNDPEDHFNYNNNRDNFEQRKMLPSPYFHQENPRQEPKKDVHLSDYINVIVRRKWIVLAYVLAVIIATAIFTYTRTPLYKSSAVLRIEKESQYALPFSGLPGGNVGIDYYTTQYEILKSQSLAERVIARLDLRNNKDFLPGEGKASAFKNTIVKSIMAPFSFVSSLFGSDTAEVATGQVPVTNANVRVPLYLVNSLIGGIDVTPVKNSQLVKVSYSSHNPQIAYDVTAAISEEYIQYDLGSRIDAMREAKVFLEDQINITTAKVEDSERRLYEYAAKNEIVFLDSNNQSIVVKELSDINSFLSKVNSERLQKEMLLREAQKSGSENAVISNNTLILGLKSQLATLEGEYSNLLKTFTPDYPKMKQLKSQMDSIENRIKLEKANIISSIKSDKDADLETAAYLRKSFDQQKRKAINFQETSAEYQTLLREVEANKQLHNDLLHRLTEVSVAAMSKASNIQIVDLPRYPAAPYKPDKKANFILSIFFGLVSGCGLAFLLEYFDKSVKDIQDIEEMTDLPTLGIIPYMKSSNLLLTKEMTALPNTGGSSQERRQVTADSVSRGPFAESFRSIGTFILLSSTPEPPRTILVTSAEGSVGKTTTSINTAVAMSRSFSKGIIIDADLRRPKVHHSLGLDNTVGLSSLLSGDVDFNDLYTKVVKPTSVKGLSVITSGPVPHNPTALLLSPIMRNLLMNLYPLYEFIIIDSPPVIGISDAAYLSTIVDGTVLVVRSGETHGEALSEVRNIFSRLNSKIIGVVLNGARPNDLRYGDYYYSSYFKGQN